MARKNDYYTTEMQIIVDNPSPEHYLSTMTSRCVSCGDKATKFGGYVHGGYYMGTITIIAGWCDSHGNHKSTIKKCMGCYGKWKPEMGIRYEIAGETKKSVKVNYVRIY